MIPIQHKIVLTFFFTLFLFLSASGQEPANNSDDERQSSNQGSKSIKPNYRFLQGSDMLIETAYLQDDDELEHRFTFSRTGTRAWSFVFTEELPLGNEKHQLGISIPSHFLKTDAGRTRIFGDVQLGYNYSLLGGEESRFAISPGVEMTLPTGGEREGEASNGVGVSLNLPVSVALSDRFASNSAFEFSYARSARNAAGEKADLKGFELGQGLVWFARPKLNFVVEAIWERSQEFDDEQGRQWESELFVSPGVRWAHTFKNGLVVVPAFGVPIGFGPSRGDNRFFFSISFEHSLKRRRD